MDIREARGILSGWDEEDEEPVALPASVLPQLTIEDVPDGATIQVGTWKENVLHLDWSGTLGRDGNEVCGEADHTMTRKYWYSPLGLEQYLDLVRRAVETRHRVCGDVELTDYDDDGAYVSLRFRIKTTETNLGKAYDAIPEGGAFIAYDSIIDDDRSKNAFGLMMSLNMLIETPGGFDYTGADCIGWMKETGFRETRVEHLVGPDSMVVGIK